MNVEIQKRPPRTPKAIGPKHEQTSTRLDLHLDAGTLRYAWRAPVFKGNVAMGRGEVVRKLPQKSSISSRILGLDLDSPATRLD